MVEEMDTDVAVVGAGPYGLSVAAHLQAQHTQFRIFGSPMEFWRNSMPQGMQLNSAGGASSLSDPSSSFSLAEYCAERSIPYADQGLPVALETFVSYGLEFQKRFVPTLEQEIVTSITAIAGGFLVVLENGEEFSSRSAVVTVGSGYFSHLPSVLTELPEAMLSHSSRHGDLNRFTDRDVAVVGGGTSALDLAGLLHDAGARPTLIVRQPTIGTAAGWSMRDAVVGHVPVILGASVDAVSTSGGRAHLHLASDAGDARELAVDHVIAATGYQVDLGRLTFLHPSIRSSLEQVQGAPVLSPQFESSVAGLSFVGAAAAASSGPDQRCTSGAEVAARRVALHLSTIRTAPRPEARVLTMQ
jgi:thioredoxin reductase